MGRRKFPWITGMFGGPLAYGAPKFREVSSDTRMSRSEDFLTIISDGGEWRAELPSVNSADIGRPYVIINRGASSAFVDQAPSDPANSIGGVQSSFELPPNEVATLFLASTRVWMVSAIGAIPP